LEDFVSASVVRLQVAGGHRDELGPGQSISLFTSESDVPTSQIMPEAARIFAMAMEHYWSSGRPHGDLNRKRPLRPRGKNDLAYRFGDAGGLPHL
jgi:hypothetical protein